jgi:hypothetical protein
VTPALWRPRTAGCHQELVAARVLLALASCAGHPDPEALAREIKGSADATLEPGYPKYFFVGKRTYREARDAYPHGTGWYFKLTADETPPHGPCASMAEARIAASTTLGSARDHGEITGTVNYETRKPSK